MNSKHGVLIVGCWTDETIQPAAALVVVPSVVVVAVVAFRTVLPGIVVGGVRTYVNEPLATFKGVSHIVLK